jgi:hypothetical protein
LLSNNNNKPLLLQNSRQRKLKLLFKGLNKQESLKRSKIKLIEKMPSLLQCKKPKRKLKHSLKLPGRRLKRRLS